VPPRGGGGGEGGGEGGGAAGWGCWGMSQCLRHRMGRADVAKAVVMQTVFFRGGWAWLFGLGWCHPAQLAGCWCRGAARWARFLPAMYGLGS
jgi:hypothetical protein